jgi:CheY-like chemotaxis protein
MIMPGMNGEQAMGEIRRLRPSLPVLVVSGSMQTSPFPEDAAAAFLMKPFGKVEFLAALETLMNGHGRPARAVRQAVADSPRHGGASESAGGRCI